MKGQKRTVASPQGCQQRCQKTAGCKYFNSFPNGGCHITTGSGGIRARGGTAQAGSKDCAFGASGGSGGGGNPTPSTSPPKRAQATPPPKGAGAGAGSCPGERDLITACPRYAKMKCPKYYPNGYCKKSKNGQYHGFMRYKCIATCIKIDSNFPCPTRKRAAAALTDRYGANKCSMYKRYTIRCPRSKLRGKNYCCHTCIKRGCARTCQGTKC